MVISYIFLCFQIYVSFLNLFLFFVILLLSFLFFFFFFGGVLWVLGPWFRGQRAGLTGNIWPQGILIRVQYPRSPYLKTKTQLYPTACKLNCWKLQAEQLVKEEHSSSHQKNFQDQIKEEEVGEIGSHQLQIGTCQGHLPSASAGIWASLVAQSVKKSACSAGNQDSIPWLGRSPGEGNGNTLQYPCLENLMD